MIQHSVHPQLSGHDGQPWHVHYTESGSMADKYAAGAAMGLAVRLSELGVSASAPARRSAARECSSTPPRAATRRYCSDRCAERAAATLF